MRWFLSKKSGSASLMLDRLNTLSDGVTAIVLTLLVLGRNCQNSHKTSHAMSHWFVEVPSSKAAGTALESRTCQSRRISGRMRKYSRGYQLSPNVRL
jgi:hypothetical protein